MKYLQMEHDVMVEMNEPRTGFLVALIIQESPRFDRLDLLRKILCLKPFVNLQHKNTSQTHEVELC